MGDERALAVRPTSNQTSTLSEVRQMAEAAAKSGLFPQLRSPDAAMTLMMLCQAEGLHPIQALRRFDVVQGRPAMKADAMLGEFQQRGGKVKWSRHDAEVCSAVFEAPGLAEAVTVTWTMEDAKRAGLAGKSGPWQQYPRQMLRARVISEGVRMAMPAVVVGLYAPEEVQDFARPAPVEVVVEAPKAPANDLAPAPAPVTSAAAPTTGGSATPSSDERAKPGQVKALVISMERKLGLKEQIECLNWVNGHLAQISPGRTVETRKDLTGAECMALLEKSANGEMPSREPGSDDFER